jgi:hypothetical protein
MKHAKKKFSWKKLGIIVGIVVGVLVLSYAAAAVFFNSHFGFNTSIDNEDCTFRTAEQVEVILSDKVDRYSMTIEGRDAIKKTIKAQDVGLTYVSDGQVQELLADQHPLLWITRLFRDPDAVSTKASVELDTAKLKRTIDKFNLFDEEKMRIPVDAYAEFKDSRYVVHPEDPGSTFDETETRAVIHDELLALAEELDLSEAGCYTTPRIYANNPDLHAEVEAYNQYVPFSITYTFGDKTEVLDALTTIDWVVYDESGTGAVSEEALLAWVRDFGSRHDTVGTERSFKTAAGEDATVAGGTYGWEVDEEAEIEAIWAALANHTGETREPIYVQGAVTYADPGQPEWGTTYIELDLTNQHMYYLVDGEIVFDAPVVTGSPYPARATPPGVYSILEMLSPATLKGEIQSNGKPEYVTKVSYWMRMTWAGHGFHDATWQPWFGGDRYTYAGSHGCINMSYGSAQTLYGILEVGTPVVSHY